MKQPSSTEKARPPRAIHRRDFLKRTATAAAGAMAFNLVPASALGKGGAAAPSERITVGCIGLGSQGTGDMKGFLPFKDVRIAAVCDVDRSHRLAAKKIVDDTYSNTDCKDYNDFRELLARPDLDAILIAVPDHWHSIPAIAAAQSGRDIYAEKPLALTINEGKAMVAAVERYGVVWQTGSWQRSQDHFRKACELVRSGRIGEVHSVQVGLPTGSAIEPQKEEPIPEGFDYNFWLGPAPYAPYTKQRCHWNFRWNLDYSGGQLTDWAAHHCDIANWGMGTEYTGPVNVAGRGEFPRDGLWNTAINYLFAAEYAPGASPIAPKGFTMYVSNQFPMGVKFMGSEGWVYVDRGNRLVTEPASLKDTVLGDKDVHLYTSDNHARNFFDCVRSRKDTITPIQVAHRAISIAHLGNIAMKLGRPVNWDPAKQSFVNDPDAERKLMRAMREPWTIS